MATLADLELLLVNPISDLQLVGDAVNIAAEIGRRMLDCLGSALAVARDLQLPTAALTQFQ